MANHRKRFCVKGHDTKIVGRLNGGCMTCRRDASRRRTIEQPEATKAAVKKWALANKDKIVDRLLQREYGITLADKQGMFDAQGGKCKICLFVFKDIYAAHTDHCHKSKKVRGLLCDVCNRKVLPVLELYFDRIESAKRYLAQAA